MSARDIYEKSIRQLPAIERLQLASFILDDLAASGGAGLDMQDGWSEEDIADLSRFAVNHTAQHPTNQGMAMPDAGDVVWLEFPGAVATKRRPAVVLSSNEYHAARPDVIVGLITSQVASAKGPTDHLLSDWASAGLRVPSAFRTFLATLPRSAVLSKMGHLSTADWQAVRQCVQRAIAAS